MTSSMGLRGSETKAWSVRVSKGSLSPAMAAKRLVEPATAKPSRWVVMRPRLVITACTCPLWHSMSLTSQFSMMSTPSELAARAYAQATASWRTVPARPCQAPPSTGRRWSALLFSQGSMW